MAIEASCSLEAQASFARPVENSGQDQRLLEFCSADDFDTEDTLSTVAQMTGLRLLGIESPEDGIANLRSMAWWQILDLRT